MRTAPLLLSTLVAGLTIIASELCKAALPEICVQPNSSCAYIASSGGTLFSWGANIHGELGDGTTISTTNPVTVFQAEGLNGWRTASAGAVHVLAIGNNDQLYSWGDNHSGQLGYGSTMAIREHLTPMPVPVPAGVTAWKAVAAGNSSSLALSREGEIYGWGLNSQGNLGIGTNLSSTIVMYPVVRSAGVSGWKMIAAGQSHGLAIAQDGRLFAWGAGGFGQLGNSNTTNAYAPVQVGFPTGVTNWTSVRAGAYHSLAMGSDGELYGWGRNNSGQLGIGNTNDQLRPILISRPIGVTAWTAIAVGAYHCMALSTDGSLYAWGNNYQGQLGLGYTNSGVGAWFPTLVPPPDGTARWVAIGAAGVRSLGLDENCRLFRWGGEGNGLGGSDSPSFAIIRPGLVAQLDSLCVAGTNLSPSVALVAPTNGSIFPAPANVFLQAAAGDADGEISQVRFYSSGRLVGSVTNAPFEITVSNLNADYYTFTAAATDNRGASVMSAPKVVLVNDNRYFNARINFQPVGTEVPAGYFADTGQVYGDRGHGLFYGWNADNSANIFARNSLVSPDQRYDTLAYLDRGGSFSWEIAVPNGFYQVHFVRGDAIPQSHFYQTVVENWLIGDSSAYYWDDNWIDVLEVKDGRLTVSNYFGSNNKICFIEIQGIDAPPTLSITGDDVFASEGVLPDGSTNTARVTITRVGNTNAPLWVSYTMSGTASNTVDFFQVYHGATNTPWNGSRGSFYIPAGQSSVAIDIVPLENDLVESNKTVTFAIDWSVLYNLASGASTTTVTVADNDFVATGASPALALTHPVSTDVFIAPTNILLQAQAGPAAGAIERMDFLVNGTNLIGSLASPPFSFLWTNVPAGFSSFSVRALNSTRASIYSLPVEILVFGPECPRPARLASQPTSSSSYLINTNGMLFSWGNNLRGQLGIGSTVDAGEAQSVAFPAGVTGWNAASGGSTFALAIASNGRVYSWGQNSSGQLGLGNTNNQLSPVLIPFSANIAAWRVAAGSTHSLLLDSFGRLYSWGSNGNGELGNGTTNNQSIPQPVVLPAGVTAWSAVSAGIRFSVALGDDGNIYTWGRNNIGQLGNNATTNSALPVRVSLPVVNGWKAVAAGSDHGLALSVDGQLYSWGFNSNCQLGYSTTNSTQPFAALVPKPTGVSAWTALAAGGSFSLASAQDGKLYAWGYDSFGRLGTGLSSQIIITNPTPVLFPAGVTRWMEFTAGNQHCLAIGDDDNLYSWGTGVALGQGDIPSLTIPTRVSRIANLGFTRSYPEMDSAAVREGQFQFHVASLMDGNTCIEWSTNLVQWISVRTNSSGDSFFTVPIFGPAGFYRIRVLGGQ
jgi:alpha-tubulin suppressor-like RCC1 family protein